MLVALFALVNSLPGALGGFSSTATGNIAIYWGKQLLPTDMARTSSNVIQGLKELTSGSTLSTQDRTLRTKSVVSSALPTTATVRTYHLTFIFGSKMGQTAFLSLI